MKTLFLINNLLLIGVWNYTRDNQDFQARVSNFGSRKMGNAFA